MIKEKFRTGMAVALLLVMAACSKTPEIDNATMLDGNQVFDPSLYNPSKYLVSAAYANPGTAQKNTPVVIAVHGYSASTFEWDEFRTYCDSKSNVLVSQVLLGGHGRTYEDFKNATWQDWQTPILAEYNALKAKGYTNINFAGSSTACPLVMDLIRDGKIGANGMKRIFLIDPIVIPSDKMLTLIGIAGPMLGYIETPMTPGEEGHYYHFRPQETLKQLEILVNKSRKDLQEGFNLPTGTRMKIYKSIKDPSADPVSAVLIYKGLKNNDGSSIEVEMIDSELHVITRLSGLAVITQHDRNIQLHVFDDMYKLLMQ